MRIVKEKIAHADLLALAQEGFGNLVKAVVDVRLGVIAVGGDLHADEEAILLEQGSKQQDLWGISIYPKKAQAEWIEFDSVINIRPSQGNRSRGVDNPQLRERILQAVNALVEQQNGAHAQDT